MNISKRINMLIKISTYIGLIIVCILVFWGYRCGIFSSVDTLKDFILNFGFWAPIIFILIQIVQIVFPILPGGVSTIAGVMIFGNWLGFLYNYIGICIGSILVFFISRKFGQMIVRGIIGDKSYDKYIVWLDKGKKFEIFFALAILSPMAPDDLLCYIAGLSKLSLKKYILIILLAKPPSIAMYSMGLTALIEYLYHLIF